MIIRTLAYARAGLIGNPSDGYYGKTIALIVRNFGAEVTCYQTPKLAIVPCLQDHSVFNSLEGLTRDVQLNGYYGGVRLIKATLKRFCEYCRENAIALEDKNCTLEYNTNIPLRVGLGGSSAIIIATLKALMSFYGVDVPLVQLPNLALSVEHDELGISAGLQDRVIQAYEGCVYMDFDRAAMERQGHGQYATIDPTLLPPLFVAYDDSLSEGTEVYHNKLRSRWEQGDAEVRDAMEHFASLAEKARDLLEAGRPMDIASLLDESFDARVGLSSLNPQHVRLVETGRGVGAHVKYAGSGGAVIGVYEDEEHFERISSAYNAIGAKIIRPDVRGRNV